MCIGFPGGTSGNERAYQPGDIRDTGLIPRLGRSPGRGHSPVFLPRESRNRGTWWVTVHRVTECVCVCVCVSVCVYMCVYIHIHLTLSHAAQIGYVI